MDTEEFNSYLNEIDPDRKDFQEQQAAYKKTVAENREQLKRIARIQAALQRLDKYDSPTHNPAYDEDYIRDFKNYTDVIWDNHKKIPFDISHKNIPYGRDLNSYNKLDSLANHIKKNPPKIPTLKLSAEQQEMLQNLNALSGYGNGLPFDLKPEPLQLGK